MRLRVEGSEDNYAMVIQVSVIIVFYWYDYLGGVAS